jgi:hypothetical protein
MLQRLHRLKAVAPDPPQKNEVFTLQVPTRDCSPKSGDGKFFVVAGGVVVKVLPT